MPRPTFKHMWEGFEPAPLHEQIKLLTAEIPIHQAMWDRKLRTQNVHPSQMHAHMHTLRSVLFTLRQLEAQQAAKAGGDAS